MPLQPAPGTVFEGGPKAGKVPWITISPVPPQPMKNRDGLRPASSRADRSSAAAAGLRIARLLGPETRLSSSSPTPVSPRDSPWSSPALRRTSVGRATLCAGCVQRTTCLGQIRLGHKEIESRLQALENQRPAGPGRTIPRLPAPDFLWGQYAIRLSCSYTLPVSRDRIPLKRAQRTPYHRTRLVQPQ
jgi:hypothetical protein